MNLPENVKFSEEQADGSQLLMFENDTAWVASACPTCAKETVMELIRREGAVVGIRFMPVLPDIVPDGIIDDIKRSRETQKADWDANWPS